MSKRSKVFSIPKKILIALGIALFLSVLAWFPGIGYYGKASLKLPFEEGVIERQHPYRIVTFSCDITFNPFLFPLSWLSGNGSISGGIFKMIYWPQSLGSASPDVYPYYPSGAHWGSFSDMEQEGLMNVVMSRLSITNFLLLFVIFFVIELFGKRGLLLCVFGGIVGFAFGGLLGCGVGFMIGALLFIFVVPIIKKSQLFQRIFYPKEGILTETG